MNKKNLAANSTVIAFMFSCLIFGLMAVGVVSAATDAGRTGSFVNKHYEVNGGWTIEKRGNEHVITFTDDFSTKGGPDLKVFLSPRSINDVTGSDATQEAVFISALTSNSGAQEYVIPADINLADYRSILIHCEKFSVLWGGTDFLLGS